ncbi:ScbA/BarX family gamma-butyrolactone biosynthesis protein [Streptomyces sp. NPDC051954]|uniref:ScbA/BarX family gamma-butyrolactone biosynthesis protein n=1 Tax=unclassified Streptomyces TaxID=2593676 RepID=UPI0034302AE2
MSASTFRVERAIPSARLTVDSAAPTGTSVFHYPSLTTTVPKEFVHRASVAEVMLTDWDRIDEDRFTVSAQWPRGHSFFAMEDRYNPLIAAETIRQVGALLAHAEFGVPLGHQFLMWDLEFNVHPEQLIVGSAPASLDLDIACTEINRRGGGLTGLRYKAVVRRDDRPVATGSAAYTCISPVVYRRLRGRHTLESGCPQLPLTAPLAPQTVGRLSPMDVVLSPVGEQNVWHLRVDTRHPVLFDHPVDHVPGMMLLEAARQATAATLGRSCMPLDITGEFKRYTELDSPCVIETCRIPGTGMDPVESVLVTGHQNDRLTFRSTVTVASPAE